MKTYLYVAALVVVFTCSGIAVASPYIGTGEFYLEPAGWNVGDSGSTFQLWDELVVSTGNTPDGGYTVNPAIASQPTLNAVAPGFATGSGNFYSFMGDYSAYAEVFNHNLAGTDGTHVIVQTTSTMNGSDSVFANSLEIVDLGGNAIAGGSNVDAIVNAGQIVSGTVDSPLGPVELEVLIWEFFLPEYTGDFRVDFDVVVHASFDQMRVDSMIAPTAFPATFVPIPEPGSLALGGLALLGLCVGRTRRRVARS